MKINVGLGLSIFSIGTMLFFQGCGSSSGDNHAKFPAGDIFKYNRISIAGSSITWGQGYLGEKSYVGEVMKYFREDVADTLNPKELPIPDDTISDLMSYRGQLNVYYAGSKISGKLKASDDITIVYSGSGKDTNVEMEVDGTVCGSSTIRGSFKPVKVISPNNPIDSESGNVRSFRETEPRSVAKICKNLDNKDHNFTLTVKSGELHLNFITNHMYYFQNAGIGGYAASTILGEPAEFPNTTTDEVVAFNPDLFIFESATNDANTWSREKDSSTNEWKMEAPKPFTIVKDKQNQIKLSQSPSKSVDKGDVVVMGSYSGDIRDLAVGIVRDIKSDNILVLDSDVPADIVMQCKIKSIKKWEENVKEVIRRVKSGVGHNLVVGIGTSGVPNYYAPNGPYGDSRYARRLMGYREKGIELAQQNGWMFFDFFNSVKAFNPGIDNGSNKWSFGDNTHPNEQNGYRLFGETIVNILNKQ